MAEQIGRSAVLRALPVFRDLILKAPDGAFVGSESDLIERIGVSAPTLRQVARLLEHEELLVIRRGVGGGFFGRRPSADTVARSAALFLGVQNTPPEEIYSAAQSVNAELMRRAALCNDEGERARLAEIVESWRAADTPLELASFIPKAEQLTDQLAVMARNAPLALFLRVFRQISLARPGVLGRYRENADAWRRLHIRLGEAVLARDPDAAVKAAEALSELGRASFAEPQAG